MDKEEIKIVILVILLIVFLVVGTCGVVFLADYLITKNITCPNFAESVNLDSKYNFWAGGCFVNYEGQWIPADNLRAGKLD
jgi:hypothetical protein